MYKLKYIKYILTPAEIEALKLLHRGFQSKNFICYEYLRKIYRGRYSFSTIARCIRSLRKYGLIEPIGTRRGCFTPTDKFYEVCRELGF